MLDGFAAFWRASDIVMVTWLRIAELCHVIRGPTFCRSSRMYRPGQ